MKQIKDFFNKYEFIDVILLSFLIILISFFVSNHIQYLFPDRGRELMIPAEMLKGKVLYKDIMMIYFPQGYYINAFIYKLLGVNLNSFIISQTILCSIFMSAYYFCARVFVERKEAFLITLFIIFACIFSYSDLFNFITPYSYSMVYGVIGFFFCTFALIKLFKTDNVLYAYLASLAAGFSFMCKFEFFTVFILLAVGICLYKRLKFSQYLKILLCCIVFPLITVGIMLWQGVTPDNIREAADFGCKFSSTGAIRSFLGDIGMYPLSLTQKWHTARMHPPLLVTLIVTCFLVLKLEQKYKKKYIIPALSLLIVIFFYANHIIHQYWTILPIFLLLYSLLNIKKIMSMNKAYAILVLAAILSSQRIFFGLSLMYYGVFSFPIMFMCLYVLFKEFLPQSIGDIKIEKLMSYVLIILITLHLICVHERILDTPMKVSTDKGTFYTTKSSFVIFRTCMAYINQNIDKNASILVLPEGNFINYLTDRKVDMKCFMMDRLYHDAYGKYDAKNKIAETNSDYIILVKDKHLTNAHRPYLYDDTNLPITKYINDNYVIEKQLRRPSTRLIIMKRASKK